MIFTSETGKNLASLVKTLDKVVGKSNSRKCFINVVGSDSRSKLQKQAKVLGKGLKNIPVVVPVEFEAGPANFGVNPKAGITVMLYKGARVRQNIVIAKGKLDKKASEKIVKASAKFFGVKVPKAKKKTKKS